MMSPKLETDLYLYYDFIYWLKARVSCPCIWNLQQVGFVCEINVEILHRFLNETFTKMMVMLSDLNIFIMEVIMNKRLK